MNKNTYLILGLATLCAGILHAQPSSQEITADDIRAHIRYLASDNLEGRASGSAGNHKAAEYIAGLLRDYHIAPGGDEGTYFQTFSFVSAVRLGENNSLVLKGLEGDQPESLGVNNDFRPLAFSSSGTVRGQLVFAGYGISAPDLKYDDYRDLDVKGKIAVVLRYAPDGENPRSQFFKYTTLRNKVRTARDKGAIGLILLTGPVNDPDDDLVKLSFDQVAANSGIPAVSMKRTGISRWFALHAHDLKTIQDSIKSSLTPQSFDIPGVSATITTDVVEVMSRTSNVIGYLEGNDPALKDQDVVLGAHFDHLGYGGQNSGSMQPDTVAIHHGADDNASGTAGLLELAQKFSATGNELKRTIIFTFFSGEELGTLGSSYYVEHPLHPLSQTVAMLNLDMVGRIDHRSLSIGGTGTSTEWPGLLNKLNADSTFSLTMNPEGFGPSDHASFYAKDIPVLFFFTGTHSDYHKPSDTWDKINYPGETKVVRYAYRIAKEIDDQPERPPFVRVQVAQSSQTAGDGRGFSVTLGVVPDFTGKAEGMKISGIRPGGPAEKAGLKSGDTIVKMAGKKVLNIYDYMGVLGELKAGDEVEVEVLRDGKPLQVHAVMEKRK